MKFLLLPAVLLVSMFPASADAYSVGPKDGTEVPVCTFGSSCAAAAGAADGACAYSSGAPQVLLVYKFGFNLPASAVIDGIVVEVKMGDDSCPASVQVVKGGSPMPATLPLNGPDTMSCSGTTYVTAGTPTELWGTTWTRSDINYNEGFGIRVLNNGCTGTGVDSARVTVHFSIPGEQCADGYTTGTEQCDDGNFERGDGCSFGCEIEQALTKDQQKCVTTVNKGAAAVSRLAAKVGAKCAKDVANGKESDFGACETEGFANVTALATKIQTKAGALCPTTPPFGLSDSATATGAATLHTSQLIRDVFDNPPAFLPSTSPESACQQAALKAADRILALEWSLFNAAKKSGLSGKTLPQIVSASDLLDIAAIPPDPKDKLSKLAISLVAKLDKACPTEMYSAIFGAPCSGALDAGDLLLCLGRRAECRRCLIANEADDLDIECNFLVTGGCPP